MIPIGAKVKIVNKGKVYRNYESWATGRADFDKWENGRGFHDTDISYTVINKGLWGEDSEGKVDRGKMLFLVEAQNKQYIIGREGIEIENEPFLKEEEMNL